MSKPRKSITAELGELWDDPETEVGVRFTVWGPRYGTLGSVTLNPDNAAGFARHVLTMATAAEVRNAAAAADRVAGQLGYPVQFGGSGE
jgi:hypothetical protein